MNIERDVILDLLPLYLSAEASPATRQLIEEWAREDAEIALLLNQSAKNAFLAGEEITLPRELEMKSLERTKSLLKLRSMFLGVAIFLSLLPFSIRGGVDGVNWLWRGAEAYAVAAAVLAALTWGGYVVLQRRLRISGL